jgi:type IV pilus assembly protein PilM
MVDWKKEIKLSDLVRRSNEPRGVKERKRASEPRRERVASADKTPFWKKELSFGSKAKATAPKATAPKAAERNVVTPKPEAKPAPAKARGDQTPFWKKELSFGGKPKTAKPKPEQQRATPPKPDVAAEPPAQQPVPAPAEQPSWPMAKLSDEPEPAVDQPAPAADEPAPAVTDSTEEVVPAAGGSRGSRLKGLSVPRPKLPGKPARRASDHGGRPPEPSKRRASFGKLQSLRRRKAGPSRGETKAHETGEKASSRLPSLNFGRQSKTSRVGLKIGASQLAAAQVVNNGAPELIQVAREPLEPGIVVGGEPRDPDALVAALRDFFRKHKLPRKGVRLGIANNRIGVRSFEVSGIDDPHQLANAIRFRAQEVLPIPLDQAVMDYQVLEERVDSEGVTRRRILLVVAYRDLIDRYVAACRQAGIKLVGVDLEAFALLRALAQPNQLPPARVDAALVVVSIGHEQSTFALSDGQTCDFTRIFDWGGASLNIAVARALDITPTQAEPIKRGLTLTGESQPGTLPDDRSEKAKEVVLQQLQAFARDLVSSLHFYQNQPGSLGIGEIVLTGGTAHMPGLPEELQRLIGVPVRLGDPLVRVKTGKGLRAPQQLGSLSVAIGLGMEG